MLTGAVGMMFGPPLAGAFNEYIFPGVEGVRYSMITMTCFFGITGVVLLQLGRKHYALTMKNTENWEKNSERE